MFVPAIFTDGATIGLTVVVIELEVAGLFVAPGIFEVIIQVTDWPVVNEEVVYVLLFVPTLTPFTCHW